MGLDLDTFDFRILTELDADCRQSMQKIGKKLRKSKEFVSYRLEKLEESDIITGYHAQIDITKLGYFSIMNYFNFQNLSKKARKEIHEYFAVDKNAFWISPLFGEFDFDAGIWARSPQEFQKRKHAFLSKFRPHIKRLKNTVMTEFVNYGRNYLFPARRKREFVGGSWEQQKIDKVDRQILFHLSENARIKLVDLGKKLNMSAMGVLHRMRSLEKRKIILGHRAALDITKLGFEYWKADIYLEDYSKRNKLMAACKEIPNHVMYIHTIGGSDLEVDFEVRNRKEFTGIIEKLNDNFPGVIRDWKPLGISHVIKERYFPTQE